LYFKIETLTADRREEMKKIQLLEMIARWVRSTLFQIILNANSGHLGGSSSSTELMVALYFGGVLKYDPKNPKDPNRDRVLVRGHLGPLRYSIFNLLGWVKDEELLTYRCFGSRLQGHESMESVPGVDITPSGMLGMGLSFGVGSAMALKKKGSTGTTWVFLGDGEEQEGNVGEAARHAASLGLTNLVGIIDKNLKQLSQSTSSVDGASNLKTIWEGYGWHVEEIDNGNSIAQVMDALTKPRKSDRPTLFIAHTVKGFGLNGTEEHVSGYHTLSTCKKEIVKEAIVSLSLSDYEVHHQLRQGVMGLLDEVIRPLSCDKVREEYQIPEIAISDGNIPEDGLIEYLNKLTAHVEDDSRINLYVLTGDVTVKKLALACGFDRKQVIFIDTGIREQHLLGMAHGIAVSDPNSLILVMESDPFLFRAADQLNVIAQAKSRMIIFGSDSGLCGARNGSTHQTVGQPGAMVSMCGLTFMEPADVLDLGACLNLAVKQQGPVYIRLHDTSVLPLPVTTLERNAVAYTAYQPSSKARLIIVASGLVVGGAVKLAKRRDESGFGIRVINAINLKDLGYHLTSRIVDDTPMLTVYNGNPGVLQSAVAKAVMESTGPRPSVIRGHGYTLGTTGKLEELLKYFRLDAEGIEKEIILRFPDLS
jgi:transketolase